MSPNHFLSPRHCRAFAVALLMSLATAASADTPIHQTRDVDANAKITIRNVKGEVRVSGWGQNRVQIEGALGSGAKPLIVDGDAHNLEIRVESPRSSNWMGFNGDEMGPTLLDVRVPRAATLDIHVVSAPVEVDGIDGAATLAVNTVSGRVHVNASADGVAVESVSGDVDVSGNARGLNVQTVSGDVQAANVINAASAQTVSGDILLHGAALGRVKLGTVSGRIQIDSAVAPAAAWKIDSMSGDVHVGLPADASAQIKADTFSGDLHSDFGKPIGSEHGPGEHLNARAGAGSGDIVINSFSGDVRIESGSH